MVFEALQQLVKKLPIGISPFSQIREEGYCYADKTGFDAYIQDWYRKNELSGYQGYYASIFYCYFTALGLDVLAEDATNKGRLDLRVKVGQRIFIFEFKVVEMTAEGNALAQLQSRRYHEKYVNDVCEIFLIGVEFSKTDRNITKFEWVKLTP